MKCRWTLAGLAFAASAAVVAADGNDLASRHCARCHGADGLSSGPGMPYLNAQLATYLLQASERLQAGRLPSRVPGHVPREIDGEGLQALADYYATLPAGRPKQEADATKVARGGAIHGERCSDCHLDSGRGSDKDAPLMAGQDLAYLVEQLQLFMNGKRPFAFLQDEAFKGLSRDDLEAVAHFFAAQDPIAAKGPGRKRR